jgi:DNA-binding response OmpR family regulator
MPAKSPELLIIDDRMESIALLLRYFQGQAFEVMVALNGKDGIRQAIEGAPNLVLLDVTMPHMDGFEVCRQLKNHPKTAHIPVLFLSAQHNLADKLQGFAAGAVDYIVKPFSLEEVMARVHVHSKLPHRTPMAVGYTGAGKIDPQLLETRDAKAMSEALCLLDDPHYVWQGVDTLATKVGVIEKRLTDLFRQNFGMSVSEFQINRRLELARSKLIPGGQQIQRIAEEAGYQNASDFSRAFRQRYGLGPREYRLAGTQAERVDVRAPYPPPA